MALPVISNPPEFGTGTSPPSTYVHNLPYGGTLAVGEFAAIEREYLYVREGAMRWDVNDA